MKYLILITLSFNIFSLTLSYKDKCQAQISKNIENVFLLSSEITCQNISELLTVIDEISKFNPRNHQPLNFVINLDGDDASNKEGLIEIPETIYAYDLDGRFPLSRNLNQNYLAHEYGHTIFNEIIRSSYLDFDVALKELAKINSSITKKLKLEVKGLPTNEIEQEIEELEFSFYTNDKYMQPILYILPYAELFSDLVSVLYADDKQAFSKTFIGSNPSQNDLREASYRDFSIEHDLSKWNNSSRHSYFAPTRSHIGSAITFPVSHEVKKDLLEVVGKAILDNIKKNMNKKVSPKEANEQLIRSLPSL